MYEVRKDSGCLWIPQWARSVFRFVSCQETIVQECVVASDAKFTGVFEVYATDDFELLARHHRVLPIPVFSVKHLLVRLYIPVIVVFVFDRGFVEDISGADVIVASEAAEKESR